MNTTPTPPNAAAAARALTHNLRTLTGPPNHRAILRVGAHRSSPLRIRPAPMPDTTSTKEGA